MPTVPPRYPRVDLQRNEPEKSAIEWADQRIEELKAELKEAKEQLAKSQSRALQVGEYHRDDVNIVFDCKRCADELSISPNNMLLHDNLVEGVGRPILIGQVMCPECKIIYHIQCAGLSVFSVTIGPIS